MNFLNMATHNGLGDTTQPNLLESIFKIYQVAQQNQPQGFTMYYFQIAAVDCYRSLDTNSCRAHYKLLLCQ